MELNFSQDNNGKNTSIIEQEEINWHGPYSWPKFSHTNGLPQLPNVGGVYLNCFTYKDGFVVYWPGETKSTTKRYSDHTRIFRKGQYAVLDVAAACEGQRRVIWPGWEYAKAHPEEFVERKGVISNAVENQLAAFRLFVAEVEDKRMRQRIEAAIILNLYAAQEHWGRLADIGMFLSKRKKTETPVVLRNNCASRIYGLPDVLEI